MTAQYHCSFRTKTSRPATIAKYLRSRHKRIITFAGFGELGYQDPSIVGAVARGVFLSHERASLLVVASTLLRTSGQDGVAAVYPIAAQHQIESVGVHPSIALQFSQTHRPSPHASKTFIVSDRSWGGVLQNGSPSPTLTVLLSISDLLVVIGGGKHASQELAAFLRADKAVLYVPAEMNHDAAREWTARARVDIGDFKGEAFWTWRSVHPNAASLEAFEAYKGVGAVLPGALSL
jgi:hypothetical protein